MLYSVQYGSLCFGIEVEGPFCVRAAPVGAWMVGKRLDFISRWVAEKRGGTVRAVIAGEVVEP